MNDVRGMSLHIGLNRVDPAAYNGWSGDLAGCENDARDMRDLAEGRGFETKMLLSAEGVYDAVVGEIRRAALELKAGDLFFLTYSGHGGQVPDMNGDELDDMDETWVLSDRQLVDDELYTLWGAFAAGVRVLVLSDSCHSGSVTRNMFYEQSPANPDTSVRFKLLPREVQEQTYRAHQELYDGVQEANPQGDRVGVGASVLLVSGCQDNQYSRDGDQNGLFTQRLLEVWSDGAFSGPYRTFHRSISDRMPPDQSPNLSRVGAVNPAFEGQAPFTI